MRLTATENRFLGKSFLFDQNFTLLTRKSFYIVILLSNDFRKKRKRGREPQKEKTHANKTRSVRERENDQRDCDRDLVDLARSQSMLRAIAISPRKCDLFWVLFVFLGMNDIMYSFGN